MLFLGILSLPILLVLMLRSQRNGAHQDLEVTPMKIVNAFALNNFPTGTVAVL